MLSTLLAVAAPTVADYRNVGPLEDVELDPVGDVRSPELVLAEVEDVEPRICAEKLVRAVAVDPTHERTPTMLFSAAACADDAKLVGIALGLRRRILTNYPDSKLRDTTLLNVARTYRALAAFAESAALYERYVGLFPKSAEAPAALANAIVMWIGLGDPTRAVDLVRTYEKLYGRKDPRTTARIVFAGRRIIDRPRDRVAETERYLRHYATKGGRHRLLISYAELGQALWRDSCKRPAEDGSCSHLVEIKPKPSCKEIPTRMRRASARTSKPARRAQGYFDNVLKLHGRIGNEAPDPALTADYNEAIGAAIFARAERDFDRLIAAESRNPLASAQKLAEQYARVKVSRSAYWVLSAAYRTAIVYVHVAQRLADQDCSLALDALRTARDAFRYCLERATEFQYFTPDVRRCEAAMLALRPDEFPAMNELVGTATQANTRMESVGVVTDWADVVRLRSSP